jgi:hypothetical protein
MFIDFKGNVAGQVGIQPRPYYIKCTHSLSQILAANWAQGLLNSVDPIKPTDVLRVLYGTNSTSYGEFLPVITGNQITVFAVVPPGIIVGPVVAGNIPKFSGTTGLMIDSGAVFSNAAKTKIVMADAALVVNNLVFAADTAGTIKDAGFTMIRGVTPTWGGGATSLSFSTPGVTSSMQAHATIIASANSVSINKVVCGTDLTAVTFSADPGAGTILYWSATKAAA